MQPSYTTPQLDQTTSGPDVLPASQNVVDHDLEGAAEIQPEPLNDFDGDAEFDMFWNTYMSGAKKGLEHEDNTRMRGESSPLDLCWESNPQSNSSLDTASLQQLIGFSRGSPIAHEEYSGGAVHVGMKSLFMTRQILYLSAHHQTRVMWRLSAFPPVRLTGPQSLAVQQMLLTHCLVGLRLLQGSLEAALLCPRMPPSARTRTLYIRRR